MKLLLCYSLLLSVACGSDNSTSGPRDKKTYALAVDVPKCGETASYGDLIYVEENDRYYVCSRSLGWENTADRGQRYKDAGIVVDVVQ